MKLLHPETEGVFETTEKAYENAWKAKGWVPANDEQAAEAPVGNGDSAADPAEIDD